MVTTYRPLRSPQFLVPYRKRSVECCLKNKVDVAKLIRA